MDSASQPPPLPPAALGEVQIPRYLVDHHNAVMAVASFDSLFKAYVDHARRWDREPDLFESVLMRQALAGACLYLSGLHEPKSLAWTINLREPATNIFVTGDVSDGFVTARLFTENVATVEVSRMYCQVQSHVVRDESIPPIRETVIEVDGLDVLVMFEAFCQRSDQNAVRFFDYEDGKSAMVFGLPNCDVEWLHRIDRDDAARCLEDARLLETRTFAFSCGCSEKKMLEVMSSVYEEQLDALFEGEQGVEVQCPRCGHEWLLRRENFE